MLGEHFQSLFENWRLLVRLVSVAVGGEGGGAHTTMSI